MRAVLKGKKEGAAKEKSYRAVLKDKRRRLSEGKVL